MTQLLEEAIARVQQLPASEQDAIAQLIFDELADEQRWDQAFTAMSRFIDPVGARR